MSDFLPSPDEMTLTIGSSTVGPWESVAVTQSIELFPNSFVFTASEPFPNDPGAVIAPPGSPCTIACGSQTLITGFVDSYEISASARQHNIVVQGRGICEDLSDCSADLFSDKSVIRGGMVNASSALDLAQRLCKSFGITARSAVADLGPPIPGFQILNGETSYEIIERVCRYAGFLLYEDANGNLVLDRVGTTTMASGFTVPGNVENARVERSLQDRFSVYLVVFTTMNQLAEFNPIANNQAQAIDPTMPRFRPRIIVSEQLDQTNPIPIAQRRADWEMARRIGRSQGVMLTCDSWRDSAGSLWKPNTLATVDMPQLKLVNQKWIIATVTFRKDLSGTHADLVLMPPAAFDPQPIALQLFDAELTKPVPNTQSPAMPSGGP